MDTNSNAQSEHRSYIRYDIGSSEVTVSIFSYKGNEVHLPPSTGFLHNISGGGLFFSSDLDFPEESDVVLRFVSPLLTPVIPHGTVIRKQKLTPTSTNLSIGYGIRFTDMSSLSRSQLMERLQDYPQL